MQSKSRRRAGPAEEANFKQHGPIAVRTLLEEHVPRVWRFAIRLTADRHQAEDLTQETMLRAWRHRKQLRAPKVARVWLFRIAVNIWTDRLRQKRRAPEREDCSLDDCRSHVASPDQTATDREDVQRTLKALDGLPLRQREVLYLHACEGLSLAEIAEVLDTNSDTVKANLSLARKKMRSRLGDLCRDRFLTK